MSQCSTISRSGLSGEAHTNGIESSWAMLKRGYYGVYHRMSVQHLHRYIQEYSGRHNLRDKDTLDQMRDLVAGMVGNEAHVPGPCQVTLTNGGRFDGCERPRRCEAITRP